jgi:carnitine O-acetyltransferase
MVNLCTSEQSDSDTFLAKVLSDAFIQLGLQLAWYKDQNCFTAVYETALTRSFLHGRTETIRSYTLQARRFVEAMASKQASNEESFSLFREASQAHVSLTKRAILGRGIDRHLLGLRLLMKPEESSPLFSDPLFIQSQRWLLSTSGLSEGERFIGTG